MPERFISPLKKMEIFKQINAAQTEKFQMLNVEKDTIGEDIETYASCGKKRAMINGRIQCDSKYYFPEEQLFVMSGRGNEAALENFKKGVDASRYSQTTTLISGFKFEAIHDNQDASKVIGTKIIMVSTADHNGLPKWLLESFAPKGITEFIDNFIEFVKKA